MSGENEQRPKWKETLYTIIFGHDTLGGKVFDVILLIVILVGVAIVMLDSVESVHSSYETQLRVGEWVVTIVFTIEYILRLVCARNTVKYATSFFGIIDLLATVPGYLSALFGGMYYLTVVRVLRVLRIFRILKLTRYLTEATVLMRALRASTEKIVVFVITILTLVVIIGAVIYLIEGPENGFTSIPLSVYWAIVTMTTVGYGDVAPKTALGQMLASVVMILGYGILAVPTGILSAEMHQVAKRSVQDSACSLCGLWGHDLDDIYCKHCATRLA